MVAEFYYEFVSLLYAFLSTVKCQSLWKQLRFYMLGLFCGTVCTCTMQALSSLESLQLSMHETRQLCDIVKAVFPLKLDNRGKISTTFSS